MTQAANLGALGTNAGTTGILASTGGGTGTTAGVTGFKNRIINGAMVIDQRNAGASVTGNADVFPIDRWQFDCSQSSKLTSQQNQGSVTPPSGFKNYLGFTSSSAYTVGTTETFRIRNIIEGFNVADLMYGTANAQTTTLSFWARSSLTGTFGGSLSNGDNDRSYVFAYTISAANTWEYKTVTIVGDTTGTWGSTNGRGIQVSFSLGGGSGRSTTAGSWSAGYFIQPTGSTNLVSTNAATLYITGVQLEVGSTATSFDYRPYGTELALCQRYYYLHARGSSNQTIGTGFYYDASTLISCISFPTTMRSAPSMVVSSGTNYFTFYRNSAADGFDTFTGINEPSTTVANIRNGSQVSGTAGQSGLIITTETPASLAFNSEL